MSIRAKVVQRIRNILIADSTILSYVGAIDRIYAAHISTIQDRLFPAISLHFMQTSGRDTEGAWMDNLLIQIEPWFDSISNNANYTWDDVVEVHDAILNALHRVKGNDPALGLTVLEITNVQEPQQLTDQDGTMHYPSLWKIKATA